MSKSGLLSRFHLLPNQSDSYLLSLYLQKRFSRGRFELFEMDIAGSQANRQSNIGRVRGVIDEKM